MGRIHSGVHEDVMAAAEIANQAARERARKKGTCYRPVKISKCVKRPDGKWRCTATSANHDGSCSKSGYAHKPAEESTPTAVQAEPSNDDTFDPNDEFAVRAFHPNPDEGIDQESEDDSIS